MSQKLWLLYFLKRKQGQDYSVNTLEKFVKEQPLFDQDYKSCYASSEADAAENNVESSKINSHDMLVTMRLHQEEEKIYFNKIQFLLVCL